MRPWHWKRSACFWEQQRIQCQRLRGGARQPALCPLLELEFQSLFHSFLFHACSGWKRFALCSQVHICPPIHLLPQATFYWRFLCNCFLSPNTWLYISFKWLNVRGNAADGVLFPRTGKPLIPPWVSFPGIIAPISSPTPPPSLFQVPARRGTLRGGAVLDRIRDLYRTALNPSRHASLSHFLLQAHTLCTLSPRGARLLRHGSRGQLVPCPVWLP